MISMGQPWFLAHVWSGVVADEQDTHVARMLLVAADSPIQTMRNVYRVRYHGAFDLRFRILKMRNTQQPQYVSHNQVETFHPCNPIDRHRCSSI
jgi:hypothetical protein